ncbi:dof zinc finger protein 1-like [Musa acuminata AAA Group]|uniref:Dof zinc finger protein n=1 Tax=Musa acuminata subsp. malaccensis TaxID=214687 RepID=A0A804JME2_MUSAM|nr:PREDICTED: dof zinc finger protein DOF5.3-like [Musa acuminata subsp. malaccensis]XP_018683413.1 PREDICTED: dof zinc finger protein DOF5.3-like [Musa acuminata subsp. malaccensis]CAG1847944.1 unnamed protein product [Musa acuminata subsp. malaccensis]
MEQQQQLQKRQRSQQPPLVPCARCGSSDTKFCYFNNYNTSQPRYYCRTCKRHWTHGGTLRNVPEGGSSKKSKLKSSASSSSSPSLKLPQAQAMVDQMAAVAVGTSTNPDRAAMPPPLLYGGGARAAGWGGILGDEPALPAFNSGGLDGDFGPSNPATTPSGFNLLQQLVQQPRLTLALHRNLFMFQQQMNAPAFATAAPAIVAADAAATTEESNQNYHNNSRMSNMSGAPHPPPSSSSM